MADVAKATGPSNSNSAGMRSEIASKWGKLSASEIAGLESTDELVSIVQIKYSLDKNQAQTDVDAFAQGRSL
jgi:hypothetical protein